MCHIIVHLERFYSEELNSVYGNVKGLTGFRQSCLPQFLCFFSLWLALLYQWLTENLPPKFNHNNVCCSSWRFWLPKARSRHVLQDYLKERWLFIQGGKFFTIDRNNYYYWFEQVWKVPCCRMLRTFFFLFYFTGETVKMEQVWILGYGLMIVKVSATLKIAIFPYLRFQRFQIDMLESFLLKKKLEENITSVERYRG